MVLLGSTVGFVAGDWGWGWCIIVWVGIAAGWGLFDMVVCSFCVWVVWFARCIGVAKLVPCYMLLLIIKFLFCFNDII